MSDYNTEPYQLHIEAVVCKYCGEESEYNFCSDSCSRAYFND